MTVQSITRRRNSADRGFQWLALGCALLPTMLMAALFWQLGNNSLECWRVFGFGFITSTEWDPGMQLFGALPAVTGTLLTTAIAIVIAVPLAFVTALFLTEAPGWLASPLSQAVDLLAAIPSIIYGMWGLFVLAPLMQDYVQPFLAETLGLARLPFVGDYYNGFGFLTAGLILAVMILPFISAVMRDVFLMTPPMLREAAAGIGCTRWETAVKIVIRHGRRGLLGGIFIGLGRALGETMAVLFVIGNIPQTPDSIFGCGTTIAATLANSFAEADGLLRSALFALALLLLVMSFGIQIVAQWYLVAAGKNLGEK